MFRDLLICLVLTAVAFALAGASIAEKNEERPTLVFPILTIVATLPMAWSWAGFKAAWGGTVWQWVSDVTPDPVKVVVIFVAIGLFVVALMFGMGTMPTLRSF